MANDLSEDEQLRTIMSDSQAPFVSISIHLRIVGGKGGFGSLLRSARNGKKTTNFSACRDRNGNRIRDVENARRIAEYERKKAEEEAKQSEDYQQNERVLDKDTVERNKEYEEVRNETDVRESVMKGFGAIKKNGKTTKRKREEDLLEMYGDHLSNSMEEASTTIEAPRSITTAPTTTTILTTDTATTSIPIATTTTTTIPIATTTTIPITTTTSIPITTTATTPITVTTTTTTISTTTPVTVTVTTSTTSTSPTTRLTAPTAESPMSIAETPITITTTSPASTSPQLDLLTFNSIEELEVLGLELLKKELMSRGMKCGGTVRQRAERLWVIRGKATEEIQPTLLAKVGNRPTKMRRAH
eukprot:TRINITY_DN7575_c0_g1_i4.p1 TRINITY_DN7575_c0_g1~~TRINITY_DN7575_c0_g1_i4.p1  ORF type:complete len:409 (+),score=98.76 TRINITY_DN7575_c0_g1_i4:151-1227(+)